MLGAIAEHLFGAARGVDDVVYLNGGASGIGGGLIIGGVPVPGAGGYAGEFGQNRPGIATASDRRAGDGVLEDEVSRARLLAAVELMTADEPTLAEALRSSRSVTVTEELARQRRILATALANAVNVLNPSVVVLGGFLAILAEHDLDGLMEAVAAQAMPASMEGLSIRTAVLAEDRLLIGAAELAFADLLRDPGGVRALTTASAQRRRGGRARSQPGRQAHVRLREGLAVHEGDQHLRGHLPEALHRLTHGAQRRRMARRLGDVVEADHRKLIGDGDPELCSDAEHRDRRQVVRREDRGRSVHEREQVVRELAGGVLLVATDDHQRRVEGDSGLQQRAAIAGVAQHGGAQVRAA